jgi:DNA primase
MNFQIDILIKGSSDALNPQEKTNIASQLLETIKKQPDEIIKREWVRTAADRLDIDANVLLRKAAYQNKYQTPAPQEAVEEKVKDNTPPRESDLIKLLLKYPRYADNCKELTEEHFENNEMWLILNGVKAIREETPNVEEVAALLIEKLPSLESTILKLSLEAMPKEVKPLKDIEDCLALIRKAAYAKRLKHLQEELKKYPSGQVPLDLLKEQIEIQKKLKS